MAFIKLLIAPIRRLAHFPLVQFIAAIAAVLWLQAADSKSVFGQIFGTLDTVVDATIRWCALAFEIKSFTRSWLTVGLMIAYVYLAGFVLLWTVKIATKGVIEALARRNAFGLTNTIARERGIAAYRAWLPLERIRPAHIPPEKWEERFAWRPDGKPPYPPLAHRLARAIAIYLVIGLAVAACLQAFTPFPALTWLGKLAGTLVGKPE